MKKKEVILELRNIKKRFANFELGPVNLKIINKDYLILLGPTGSGKTILLQLVCGNLFPDEGEILLDNSAITKLSPEQREVGIVYQDYLLFPHMSVDANINFGKSYYLRFNKNSKKEYEERYNYLINVLNIKHLLNRHPQYLSGGERQRIALARSLVLAPKIILLDEPLSAIDNSLHEKIMNVLNKITYELKLTAIHITHNKEEAFYLGNKIVLLNKGKIEQKGKPCQLLKKPSSSFVANFLGSRNLFEGLLNLMPQKNKMEIVVGNYSFILDWRLQKFRNNYKNKSYYVLICIPAEDIVVSQNKNENFQYNIKGIVRYLQPRFSMVLLTVEVDQDIRIDVIMSYQELKTLNLTLQSEIFLCFNDKNVHVINICDKEGKL